MSSQKDIWKLLDQQKDVFKVPEGYFEDFRAADTMDERDGFGVPKGYFESFKVDTSVLKQEPKDLSEQIKAPNLKPSGLVRALRILSLSAAAVLLFFLGLNKVEEGEEKLSAEDLTSEEVFDWLDQEEDAYALRLNLSQLSGSWTFEEATDEAVDLTTEEELDQYIEQVELENYLYEY